MAMGVTEYLFVISLMAFIITATKNNVQKWNQKYRGLTKLIDYNSSNICSHGDADTVFKNDFYQRRHSINLSNRSKRSFTQSHIYHVVSSSDQWFTQKNEIEQKCS